MQQGYKPRAVPRVLTVLLAGGAGERLSPLTREEAKPMMSFGGIYRLIDVTLSNCIHSGLTKIFILTQHKALSLNRHIREAWSIFSPELGQFIEAIPPTRRRGDTWYLGTADAVYQNLQSIEEEDPPLTLILSADHVYKMNYRHIFDWHNKLHADVTVATSQVSPEEADRFGIVEMDQRFRISAFEEKPKTPRRSYFNPEACSASMGIYLFSTPVLREALVEDAEDSRSTHDFGRDVLPRLIERRLVVAYDSIDENRKEVRYWRDVGTLDAYYEANIDLVDVNPVFNLYDQDWPIRTGPPRLPPAKFVFAEEGCGMGVALDSLVSHGCIISGARVVHSVLSPGVHIDSHCIIEDCIIHANVRVGARSRIRRAIIAQDVFLPEDTVIGFDPKADHQAGHFVTDSGIVVVHADSPGARHTKRRRASPMTMTAVS
jgi:glucose-1-phosphate adenylyltransferase